MLAAESKLSRDIALVIEKGERFYRLRRNGRRLVPVTTVIETGLPFWSGVDEDTRLLSSEVGVEVHRICYELARGNEPTIKNGFHGYALAWQTFQRKCRFEPEVMERSIYSEELGVAGTPDAIGLMASIPTVVDYTVGSASLAKRLQTAIYRKLWKDHTKDRRKYQRIEVHLRPDGTYNFRPHTNENDIYAFMALLQFYRWRLSA